MKCFSISFLSEQLLELLRSYFAIASTKGGGLSGSQDVVLMMKESEDSCVGMHIPATPS